MALPTASDNVFPKVVLVEGAAPSSPAATNFKLYVDSSDHLLKYKNSAGAVTTLGTGLADPMTTRGDVLVRNASNVTARLAIGSTGKVLSSDGTDVSWQTGGGTITTASATLTGADIAINTSTFTDILSVSLAAGTWIVMASVLCNSTTGTVGIACKVWDGTTVFASGDSVMQGTQIRQQQTIITPPIVLGGTTTVKISGKSVVAAGSILVSTVSDTIAGASNLVAFKVA